MPDDFRVVTLQANLTETAILILACDSQHLEGGSAPVVDVDVLREKFFTNTKPFRLTPSEALWLYDAVRNMSVDQDGNAFDGGGAQSRLLAQLEKCCSTL